MEDSLEYNVGRLAGPKIQEMVYDNISSVVHPHWFQSGFGSAGLDQYRDLKEKNYIFLF
jgi:hypothetical protein